jgi:hypothetical protein
MFGRLNVKKDGAKAEGVVLDIKMHQSFLDKTRPVGVGLPDQRVTLKATFEDGTQAEVQCEVDETDYREPFLIGSVLPLRYDPKNRSRIEVDVAAIKAGHRAEADVHKRKARELALNPNGPVEKMAELDRKREQGLISEEAWQEQSKKVLDDM